MATNPVRVLPAAISKVVNGGQPVVAVFGGVAGGIITNPANAADQNLPQVETLYYSLIGPAGISEGPGTFPLEPGASLIIPPGLATDISINAASTGHRFSAYIVQPGALPPAPVPTTFPPAAPSALLKTIPSYLYVEYNDDDNLQAFVRAYNEMAQEYVDWFNSATLAIYTNPLISGSLLDWIALGLYGIKRPVLSSGQSLDVGPYDTGMFNEVGYNLDEQVGPSNVAVTTDDAFKRIMTWRLYRGDGKTFSLNWLKRRIIRFVEGTNGTDPVITNTYDVSAVYASRTQIDIVLPSNPNSLILKSAIDSGAVELPFQLSFNVTISS